jgi:hypothetical protein
MATGRSRHLTQLTGEHLVAAELCRRGLLATPFSGNLPGFDVLALDEGGGPHCVQVKAVRAPGRWQFNALKFMDIELADGRQRVRKRLRLEDPGMPWVFVHLAEHGDDVFFILTHRHVQDLLFKKYSGYMKRCSGRRPKKPTSTHMGLTAEDLVDYRDRWDLVVR